MRAETITKAAAIGSEPPQTVSGEELKLINAYTRKTLGADEVYTFTEIGRAHV